MDCESCSSTKLLNNVRVAVIGAGPVGSLIAGVIGKRGCIVNVYEYRPDIRGSNAVQGRTINLSLSTRGISGLKLLGMDEVFLNSYSIPMKARFIHGVDGKTSKIPYDVLENKCIYSVERKYLNEQLITAAEKNDVTFHFEHKLISLDLDSNKIIFMVGSKKEKFITNADLIIGADGAFSAIRRDILKQPMFNYSQTYIEHGYIELRIPPKTKNEFAMPKNYLHIWPRNTFMMIALPNLDCSWTVSLFMPFSQFEALNSPDSVLKFFEKYFFDAVSLIGKDILIKDFLSSKPSPLISVKCNPHHKNGNCILIGDAAHAMVPFYGQGMNAGFEDCYIIDKLFSLYGNDLNKIMDEYSRKRTEDAAAIVDLAMYNYIEMRHLVTKRSFLLRKRLDNILYKIFPNIWKPLYHTVTFTSMRYSDCIKNKKWQDQVIINFVFIIIFSIILGTIKLLYSIK